jgi:citrate lyase beta subunit
MINDISPYQLGATLYMPATRDDITDVILRNKINGLRSLVICLEDAVSDKDVPHSLQNLKCILSELSDAKRECQSPPLTFIRPRNTEMGQLLVNEFDLSCIDGFVLPKFTQLNLNIWGDILVDTHLLWMPTLETEEAYDPIAMRELAFALAAHPCKEKILAIRIGGNDLMNVISLRRSRTSTLYDGPLAYVFKMLVSAFASKGFALTAPVCELIDQPSLLQEEILKDIEHGLVAKTAIHPTQINIIHNALAVERQDYDDALRIVNSEQAVFKSNGAMCEPATHRKWAQNILMRAKYYGIQPCATQIALTM